MAEIIAKKFEVLKSEWNERQRRLWAASKALCLGYGGVTIVSRATGLSRPTITQGIKELKDNKRIAPMRVRREGAGRKKGQDLQPTLKPTLDAMIEPTAKGDPELVKVYDFIDKKLGKATPYGIDDLKKNLGWVNVGVDHDTAEFAVESIRRWYRHLGKTLYPNAKHLRLTADGGGSNGSRNRLWKYCLQEFSDESRLTIHVSHFPPGTSKWNKIEHRLFNHISMNWKGSPLTSLSVMIELIGHTTSRSGLKVYAMEDHNSYPTKRQISDTEMDSLNLFRDDVLGKWNYTIKQR